MKKILLCFTILVFALIIFHACDESKEHRVVEDNSVLCNKMDSLLQQIVLISDLFRSIPEETKSYRFLVSYTLIPTRNYYVGYFETLYTVNKNVAIDNKIGTLFIDSSKFSIDSNIVDVNLRYYILAQYPVTSTNVKFQFDDSICNWKIIEKSTVVH